MSTHHFRSLAGPFSVVLGMFLALGHASFTWAQETPAAPADTSPAQADAAQADAAQADVAQANGADADGKEEDPLAELKRQLDKIEGQIRGEDDEGDANAKILKDIVAELEDEYRANHVRLIELREAGKTAAAADELSKTIRRQKIIVQHLIELDARKMSARTFDNKLYGELIQLQRRPEVRNNQPLQQRIMNMIQAYSQQRIGRPQTKKTIAEIVIPLVGERHLALVEPDSSFVYPAASDGVLQDYREHIKNLACIRWNGLQLELDRDHWDRTFADKTELDIIKEIDALLADRGYKTPLAGNRPRIAMFRATRGGQTNLSRLFSAMHQGQQVSRSSSSGANGHHRLSMHTDQMGARLITTPSSFMFVFSEHDDRGAILRIRQDKENGLAIDTLGDVSLRFRQAPDGAIDVVELAGDETLRFKAPSFAEFYRENVEYCELRFLPLLDHLGITLPMSRLDEQVVACVLEELQALTERKPDDAQKLIERLGSRQYSQREEAAQQLKDGIAFYAPKLRAALEKPLSVEARMRVKSLLQDAQPSPTEEMVVALKLLDDVEYLKVVKQRCTGDDQQFVASRIETLQSE